MNRTYHIYDCEGCIFTFAVEDAFENQSAVKCPICLTDDHVTDTGHGEMNETHYPKGD